MFVRKDAIVSSQIEGTQATLVGLLSFEAEGRDEAPESADIREACNYLEAPDDVRDRPTDCPCRCAC